MRGWKSWSSTIPPDICTEPLEALKSIPRSPPGLTTSLTAPPDSAVGPPKAVSL